MGVFHLAPIEPLPRRCRGQVTVSSESDGLNESRIQLS